MIIIYISLNKIKIMLEPAAVETKAYQWFPESAITDVQKKKWRCGRSGKTPHRGVDKCHHPTRRPPSTPTSLYFLQETHRIVHVYHGQTTLGDPFRDTSFQMRAHAHRAWWASPGSRKKPCSSTSKQSLSFARRTTTNCHTRRSPPMQCWGSLLAPCQTGKSTRNTAL